MRRCLQGLLLLLIASAGVAQEAEKPDALVEYQKADGIDGDIVMLGSDALRNLSTLWAEGFRKHYPNIDFAIEGKGATTAPPALLAGHIDLGTMSRPYRDEELAKFKDKYGYEPSRIVVAVDALAVFVHKDNPVEKLSLAQADAIFSSTRNREHEDVTRWGQVGLEEEWKDREITLYGRNSASGNYGFFKERVLSRGEFKKTVKEQPGSALIVKQVSEDRSGVGYCGIGYKTQGVRLVPLSASDEDAAAEPSPENCYNGKYPLSRHFYIYFNRAPGTNLKPHVREFLKFIHSRQGQDVVIKDGFVPMNQRLIDDCKAAYEDQDAVTLRQARLDWLNRESKADAALAAYEPAGLEGVITIRNSYHFDGLLSLWADLFELLEPDVKFVVQGMGGGTPPNAWDGSDADLAPYRQMNQAEVEAFEKKQGHKPGSILASAMDVAVIVHKDNPIDSLTLEQLDAIFSKTRKGGLEDIYEWSQLGLGGELGRQTINLHGRHSVAQSYTYFKEKALFKGDFKDRVREHHSSGAVVYWVEDDPAAIGFAVSTLVDSSVRTVPLKVGEKTYLPETLCEAEGSYPLHKPLYIYFNRPPGKNLRPEVAAFLRFIHSRQGQWLAKLDRMIPISSKVAADSKAAYEDR